SVFYLWNPYSPKNGSLCPSTGTWGCLFRPTGASSNRSSQGYIVLAQNSANTTTVSQNGYDGAYTYSAATRDNTNYFASRASSAWNFIATGGGYMGGYIF